MLPGPEWLLPHGGASLTPDVLLYPTLGSSLQAEHGTACAAGTTWSCCKSRPHVRLPSQMHGGSPEQWTVQHAALQHDPSRKGELVVEVRKQRFVLPSALPVSTPAPRQLTTSGLASERHGAGIGWAHRV